MKSIKINIEENTNAEALKQVLLNIKGVKSAEIFDEENPESDLKKVINKTKEQIKNGDYENLAKDFLDSLLK